MTGRSRNAAPPMRVITTKRKTYCLPLSVAGTPIEAHFPGVQFPVQLRAAKIYRTEDGDVVAVPVR